MSKLLNFQIEIITNYLDGLIENIVKNYPLNSNFSNDKVINIVCDKILYCNFESSFEDIGCLCNYFKEKLKNDRETYVLNYFNTEH